MGETEKFSHSSSQNHWVYITFVQINGEKEKKVFALFTCWLSRNFIIFRGYLRWKEKELRLIHLSGSSKSRLCEFIQYFLYSAYELEPLKGLPQVKNH